VSDATPTNPALTYSITEWTSYFTGTRPTKAQALRAAYQVAHASSLVVRRVTCSPTRRGWTCSYVR
jgi:hypothetical protein